MKGINNIKKKLLIIIFTFLFLIRFIYSQYPTGISPQNNAVSSLESNSIIQWIINSSVNAYSTAGQYLANFLSIPKVPSYVWTSITFLMATLFFVGIYLYLFEIFTQKLKVANISESETMKKAKILFIFALSVFSALAIGFAIPFLFNLYGFILLILILIALFFFGRAAISYGKSFHYSIKSFEDNVKKDLLNIENTLKDAEKNLSAKEKEHIREAEQAANSIYNDAITALKDAEKEFHNILSSFMNEYEKFTTSLIDGYKDYLKNNKNILSNDQKDALDKFINNLMNRISNDKNEFEKTLKEENLDINKIPSIRKLHDDILIEIWKLSVDDQRKQELGNILNNAYNKSRSQYKQILDNIPEVIKALSIAKARLETLGSYEKSFNDIGLKVSKFLGVDGNKKYKVGFLNALRNLEDEIKRMIASIDKEIHFLYQLRSFLY